MTKHLGGRVDRPDKHESAAQNRLELLMLLLDHDVSLTQVERLALNIVRELRPEVAK